MKKNLSMIIPQVLHFLCSLSPFFQFLLFSNSIFGIGIWPFYLFFIAFVCQTLTFAWVNLFFSGCVAGQFLYFCHWTLISDMLGRNINFNNMDDSLFSLQPRYLFHWLRGLGQCCKMVLTSTIDVSYVSRRSWYLSSLVNKQLSSSSYSSAIYFASNIKYQLYWLNVTDDWL